MGVTLTQALTEILAMLRAQSWLYQSLHWQSQGENAYSEHLLFDRLYNASLEQIDQLAEKTVGMCSSVSVDPISQMNLARANLERWQADATLGHLTQAMNVEKDFLVRTTAIYRDIKPLLSLGTDDWIMSTCNAHESNMYLLNQAVRPRLIEEWGEVNPQSKTAQLRGKEAPSGESHFIDSPRRREVREFAESGAISNDTGVARTVITDATAMRDLEKSEKLDILNSVDETPLTSKEILKKPGSAEFSQLNRYVLNTEQETEHRLPKHPVLASWTLAPQHQGRKS